MTRDYKLSAVGDTFRGEIWENCARFQFKGSRYDSMRKQYPEQDGHFDISSARQLTGPLRAMNDPLVRDIGTIKATQTFGTMGIDCSIPFMIEHWGKSILCLFETDPKAKEFFEFGLHPTLKAHPVIADMMGAVDPDDMTKMRLNFGDFAVKIGGLNETNTASLGWEVVTVSESYMHGVDGMLKKAQQRGDRFPRTRKFFYESQAGNVGEDLHAFAAGAHIIPLKWACPSCEGMQIFNGPNELGWLRPDDFPAFRDARPGTYAGLRFPDGDDIKARARDAWWECWHCGYHIEDTRKNRRAMMDSYQQDYTVLKDGRRFTPPHVCFHWPFEAAMDNSFAESALRLLTAQGAARHGNIEDLSNYYKRTRAIFWDPKLTQTPVSIILSTGRESVENDEAARVMMVDCQQGDVAERTGHFWYEVWSISKDGMRATQLARGYAWSWREWWDVQEKFEVPNNNVGIDGAKYLYEILNAAAERFKIIWLENKRTGKKKPVPDRWKILRGNGIKSSFKQVDGTMRGFSQPQYYKVDIKGEDGRSGTGMIPVFEWSNSSYKDQLQEFIIGGEGHPKLIAMQRDFLPDKIKAVEVGDCEYRRQMSNEVRSTLRGRTHWESVTTSSNTHYRDTACMGLVLGDMAGCFGLEAVDAEEK